MRGSPGPVRVCMSSVCVGGGERTARPWTLFLSDARVFLV